MRFARYFLVACVILLLAFLTVWGALALWYRLPLPDPVRITAATALALLGLGVILAQFGRNRLRALAVFAVAFAGLFAWWTTIRPSADGNWAPELARQVTGSIDGEILTLTNMRAFDWHSTTDATATWQTRRYDLSRIEGVDMVLSYWGNPLMAHFMFTFGFEDGEFLAWSIEVRRPTDGEFSPIADFFKANTMIIVAAEERDVIGLRTNIRGEDVQLYHLNIGPVAARDLIEDYVRDANALAVRPAFFNSVTTNCTTAVFRMARADGDGIPFDWRMIVNGYLPEMVYDRGAVDTSIPLDELKQRSRISARGEAEGLTANYSQAIRIGVPGY